MPISIVFFALFYAGCGDKENPSPEEILLPGEDNTNAIDSVDETTFFQDTLFYYGTDNTAIISSLESTSNSVKNPNKPNNAMGKVDTQNLTYNGEKLHGTSFAAPQALCDVRKLIRLW